jgi:hypothetical protein
LPKDTVAEGSWRAVHPADAANLQASSEPRWWIAGGWALDLFRGTSTRPHTDLDVGVLRRDVASVLHSLSTWEVFKVKGGRLTRLAAGCLPSTFTLYKSKGPRERDDMDFAQICPLLAPDARQSK